MRASLTLTKKISFTVNDPHGNLKPHINGCFLSVFLLDGSIELPDTLTGNDRNTYTCIYDKLHFQKPWQDQNIKVIGSFQKHNDGNNYVIIRNANTKTSSPIKS